MNIVVIAPNNSFYIPYLEGAAGMTLKTSPNSGSNDDGYFTLPDNIDFNFPFFDSFFRANQIFIGTNSYITFGYGTTEYTTFDCTSPGNGLFISSKDNRCENLYYLQLRDRLRLRFEGFNSSGGGALPYDLIWECSLWNNGNITLVTGGVNLTGFSSITNGTEDSCKSFIKQPNKTIIFIKENWGYQIIDWK